MESLKEQLIKKIENGFNDFVEALKKQSPEIIVERAYEKVCKEEMTYLFRDKDLEETEIKALLKSDNLLGECYDEWLKSDGNFNEMLEYAVDDRINSIVEDFIAETELDEEYFDESVRTESETLEGWYWKEFEDGSGGLYDKEGKNWYSFDLATGEGKYAQKVNKDGIYCSGDWHSIDYVDYGGIEEKIKKILSLNHIEIKERNMSEIKQKNNRKDCR